MAVCLLSCSSGSDAPGSAEGSGPGFYLEGSVRGEEGSPQVTVLLQARSSGPEGAVDPRPLDLRLDGQPLRADSSRLGGIFYEARLPVEGFAGTHRIEGNLPGDATFKREFTFTPLAFAAEPPARLSRTAFRLGLRGLPATATVMLALTDTAFMSNDLTEKLRVRNGALTLTPAQLREVASGPVLLQLTSVQELDLGKGGAGSIRVEYTLRRELELVD